MSEIQRSDLDEVLHFSAEQALSDVNPARLAVAVSGGGDSMACLEVMHEIAEAHGIALEAVTVDHGLREEARDEIALVADYCAARSIPHTVLNWQWDGTGNLQAEARKARYGLIADWATRRGVECVVLGHTKDDAAETFLMRLARRSGIDGLAHMDVRFQRHGLTWLRPLLGFRREELRRFLSAEGIDWAEDSSNEDVGFERVRARKVLEALAPLEIDAGVLTQVATNLKLTQTTLDAYMRDAAARFSTEKSGDLLLPTNRPRDGGIFPREIMLRLYREAILWMTGADYAPRSMKMLELEMAVFHREQHTLGGCLFTFEERDAESGGRCRITRELNAVKDTCCATDQFWDGRWRLAGPHADDLEIRALGEAVKDTPWRETGMPRHSLLASPAVWRGDELVAAPVAGLANGWTASATGRGNFADFLLSR